jgi:hypothetical protein
MFFLGVSGDQGKRASGQDYIRPPPGAPNKALQPIAYSVRSSVAPAFGNG